MICSSCGFKTKILKTRQILHHQLLIKRRKWWTLNPQLMRSWKSLRIHFFMSKTKKLCWKRSIFERFSNYPIDYIEWYLYLYFPLASIHLSLSFSFVYDDLFIQIGLGCCRFKGTIDYFYRKIVFPRKYFINKDPISLSNSQEIKSEGAIR